MSPCGPGCNSRALTHLAVLALPRRMASANTGHPLIFCSEPLAPRAVLQSSFWAVNMAGTPGVSFCLLGFVKPARDSEGACDFLC